MRITLRQLSVFDAVSRLGGVGKAAEELALSQSAVSSSLRDLEEQLGITLFQRRGKRLLLNETGRTLLPKAHSLLLQASEFHVHKSDANLKGTLRIGASTTISMYLLPSICGAFQQQNPDATLHLVSTHAADVMIGVQEFAYDIGFLDSTCSRPDLKCEPWISDRLAIFASPTHRLAGKRAISVSELAEVNWCLQPPASMTRVSLTMTIIKYLNPIRIGFMASNPEEIKRAVMSGQGVGCLSRFAVHDELKRGLLKEIRVKEFTLERMLSIVTRKDVYEGDLMAGFLSFARSRLPSPK